jgi:PAS domain S-box-containing protein
MEPEDFIRDAIYQGISQTELMGLGLVATGKFLWANRAMASLFGYQPEELIGRVEFIDLFHPHDRDRALEQLTLLTSGERALIQFDARGHHQAGRLVHCLVGARMVSFGQQRLPIVVITDVTERFAHLQQLRESAQLYRSIVEQSADGIAMIDETGMVIEWNLAQERISGWSRAQTLGHFIWEIQHRSLPAAKRSPEALSQIRDLFQSFLGKQIPAWLEQAMEHELERADGSLTKVQTRIFTVVTDRGFMIGAISRELDNEPVAKPDAPPKPA